MMASLKATRFEKPEEKKDRRIPSIVMDEELKFKTLFSSQLNTENKFNLTKGPTKKNLYIIFFDAINTEFVSFLR